jgi:ABC-type phosphate transport system substrate-binding protein
MILTELELDWVELQQQQQRLFVVPLVSFPIAIAYNVPLLNDTLKVTRPLLKKMLINTTMTWNNDPELVALNPGLANILSPIRMVLDTVPNEINQLIIEWLFHETDMINQNGSWTGLYTSSKHVLTRDYSGVVSAIKVIGNSIGFVPLPLISKSSKQNVNTSLLVQGSSVVSVRDVPNTETHSIDNIYRSTFITSDDKWPMNVLGYFRYDQEASDCAQVLDIVRFLYWTYNNTKLIDVTSHEGFSSSNDQLDIQLLSAKCNNEFVLHYTNLSRQERSKFLLVFSICITIVFLIMILYRYWILAKGAGKIGFEFSFHTLLIFIGLLMTLVSFVIWGFAPSENWICIARVVFIGYGITGVLASTFMYAFAIGSAFSAKVVTVASIMNRNKYNYIACGIVFLIETVIIILWVTLENLRSQEIIINPILWESRYVCAQNTMITEIIQYLYFIVITLFGCFVVNVYWKQKSQEEPRLMLGTLYSEMLIFILLIVMVTIIELSDENLYIIKTSLFIISVGNISGAWFLPQLVKAIKRATKSESVSSGQNDSSLDTKRKNTMDNGETEMTKR